MTEPTAAEFARRLRETMVRDTAKCRHKSQNKGHMGMYYSGAAAWLTYTIAELDNLVREMGVEVSEKP